MTCGRLDTARVVRRCGSRDDFVARWSKLQTVTRGLCFFFVFDALCLNALLALLPVTPQHKTVLNYTVGALAGHAKDDSWGQMTTALEEFRLHPDRPLYADVFFHRHIRFPYPPTSLFVTWVVERLGLGSGFLNLVSFVALLGIAGVAAMLLGDAGTDDRRVIVLLSLAFTFTFYPLVKGFGLGQIQTWINFLLAMILLLWIRRRERLFASHHRR